MTAFVGICLAVWNLLAPLAATGKDASILGLRLALGSLVLTAAFGVSSALDRQSFWFGLVPRRVLVLAHAHLGLLDWLGLAYVADAEKLWSMFLLAHRPRARAGTWALRLLPVGVLLLAGGLLVASRPLERPVAWSPLLPWGPTWPPWPASSPSAAARSSCSTPSCSPRAHAW